MTCYNLTFSFKLKLHFCVDNVFDGCLVNRFCWGGGVIPKDKLPYINFYVLIHIYVDSNKKRANFIPVFFHVKTLLHVH